jgi:hypothetical protein
MSRPTTTASDLPQTQSRIHRLLRTVGTSRPTRRPQGPFETLENRVLLGGDHPSFELPLTPTSGTEIILDMMTGAGSDSGVIEDTTPELSDDLFRFTYDFSEADLVRVWADTVNPGSPLDSRVEIYNLAGGLEASGSSQGTLTSGTFNDGWARFIAQPGETYFVVVRSDQSMGPAATGEYEIRINTLSEEFTVQENPTPGPGQPRYGYGEVEDELTLTGSDKVYKLTVPSATAFDSLATFYATNNLSTLDPRLDIYDEQGGFLRGNSETGRLNAPFLGVRSAPEMTFYIRIRGDVFNPSSALSTGAYILKADTRAIPVDVDPVSRRGVTTGGLPDGYDTRMFTFQSQGTGLHFVTVRGIPLPPLADPAIRLYNDAGVEIGFDRIGAELQIQLVGGETYFFVVEEFDLGAGGAFAAWLETHHTFSATQEFDDHATTPDEFEPGSATEDDRRIFERATPVIWNDPELIKVFEPAVPGQIFPFQDPNPLGDRSYVTIGQATGRIHQTGDTDLFQFVPPMDMLGSYGGDNDDAGDALFIGTSGAMTLKATGDGPEYNPVTENFLGIWDAMAYWEVQAGVSATVRAMTEWNYGADRTALVIGGEFTSANYNPTPFIAAYWFNELTGLFEFADLGGGMNDTVHALHTFDFAFDGEVISGDSLIAGGAFTNVGNHVARYVIEDPTQGPGTGAWQPLGGGLDDIVYAFTDFDSPDPEEGDAIPRFVVAGGEFGVQWLFMPEDPTAGTVFWEDLYGDALSNTNGPVYALAEFDPDPAAEDPRPELIIGGDFSSFGLISPNNIVSITIDPEGLAGFGEIVEHGLAGGANDTVYALTLWDRDGEGEDEIPELIAGGDFTNRGGRVASWTGAWAPLGLPPMGVQPGFNDTVRSLHVFTDTEYGVGLGPFEENPVLYAGGDFTTADGDDALRVAMLEYNLDAMDWEWLPMGGGVTDTVYALQNFNDEIPDAWDRKDRVATRLQIVVSPTHGGFENTFVRVFDSNMNLVYEGNDTISPPFPDPSGMVDPSTVSPDAELDDFEGIQVWGGEVYYLEVSAVSGTGRYNVSIRADAYPPDTFGGRVRDDVISSYTEPVGEPGLPGSAFAQATPINLADTSTGDGRNYLNPDDQAHNIRVFEPTPSGFQVVQWSELAVIHDITDYDVYRFRAPADGAIEIRTVTHQIEDEFYEEIADLREGTIESNQITKRYNSPLDSKISVYDNDFILLASNDDNPAFAGDITERIMGSFGVTDGEPRQFRAHDARVVIPIVSGDTYFIVVESGQYASFISEASEVDWRRAAGSYELLLNAVPQLEFEDDHTDFIAPAPALLASGTVIPIDPATGAGSITGEIRTRLGGVLDSDQFVLQAAGRGTMTLRATPGAGSTVTPTVRVYDFEGNLVASATAPGGGQARVDFTANRGDLFYVAVSGAASQGDYVIDVTSSPFVDDHATTNWHLATDLIIRDFTGIAEQSGRLEAAGDIDLFRFETPAFDFAELLVESRSPGFRPHVRVFEVSEDPAGNPVMLQIAERIGDPSAATSFSLTGPDRTSLATGETYNLYYIAVSGADPTADQGNYNVRMEVTATDDHPDEGEFGFATQLVMDTITGQGQADGDLEIEEDSDLFVFQAAAGGQASITVTATDDLRPTLLIIDQSFNPVEHLLLGTSTPIAGADEPGASATYVFSVTRGQQYYVLVDGLSGGALTTGVGTYEIDVLAPVVDDHPNEGEFPLASEIVLSQITGAAALSATVSPRLDTDLFFFRALAASTPAEPGAHRIVLDARAGGFDPILTIYEDSRAPIAVVTDNSAEDEDPTVGVVRYTAQSVARHEVFYLLVDADEGATPATGSYTLDVIGPPPGLPDPNPNDDHANEGQFVAATVILLDQRTGSGRDSGIIEVAADTDLFRFTAITDGQAFVQVVTPSGTLLDTRVTIYERRSLTEFVAIESDTVGIPGANSYVTFDTAAPGTEYYILVEDVSDGRGAYSVEIATEPDTFYLYFPEGFAGDNIREYISFANPHQTSTVTYDVVLYYENPDLAPARIVTGATLVAGARGGLTLSDAGAVFSPAVVKNEPYAVVIEADGMLGATFAHYDFGAALGESFTGRTSAEWTFARVERTPGGVEDFLVYFNPNNHDVTVTLTAYGEDGGPVTLQQTVGANRRGGWSVDDLTQLPLGVFSVRLTSEAASTVEPGDTHIGIVASLSHFDVAAGSAFAVLGDPGAGATLSVIPRVETGDGVDTEITIFNPGSTPTTVTITGSYTQAAFEDLRHDVVIAGRSFVTLSGSELGLIRNQPLGLRFASVRPVTVTAVQTEKGDAAAIQAVSDSATTWFFGDAFINRASAGQQYFETLSLYNPAKTSIAIEIQLHFNDGQTITTTLNLGADRFTEVRLHEFGPLLARPQMLNFFSIELNSPSPFIAQMDHFDLFLDGGWAAAGAPFGLLNPLSRIS